MTGNAGDELRLGFLTTREVGRGIVGGLLITNRFGRPLEFQCTIPIKASRTQEILYGQTLQPYLKCDLIGRTLFNKVAVKPHLLVTGDPELLELRTGVSVPVACCGDPADDDEHPGEVHIGDQTLTFHSQHPHDAATIRKLSESLPEDADLSEPLERVAEALAETARSAA